MATTILNYDLDIIGNFVSITFSDNTFDATYRTDSIRITKTVNDIFIINSATDYLHLDYTLDNANTFGSLEDYLSDLLTRIKSEEITSINGINVSAGDVNNMIHVNKFGRNEDVDTGTAEDVCNSGGTYAGLPISTTQTIQIFSSSTSDTSAGVGARTISISGLQSTSATDYTEETLTLNGTTPVVSVNSWYRVNRVWVETAGSTGSNVGQITVRHSTTTANVFALMQIGLNQSTIGAYTIPFDTIGYLSSIRVSLVRSSGSPGSGTLTLRIRDTLNGGVFRTREIIDLQTGGPVIIKYDYPKQLPAGADVKIRVESVSDNNTIVTGGFTILMLKDGV